MINNILKQYWGYDSFRLKQKEIIDSAMSGRDTLGVLPTGGGKSICFQIPVLAKDGIAIVVTPLISLIKDQVQNLSSRGIKALAVYSGMTKHEIDVTLDNAIYGDYKFLYLSPERLNSELFKVRVRKMDVNFLVVDEAHCISQWGYDFRPDYLSIKNVRSLLGNVPIIALTATATDKVSTDIMANLDFDIPNLIQSSFERENLGYVVRRAENKLGNLLSICNSSLGSGIVYVRERKKAEELSSFLLSQGVGANFYHAGVSKEDRSFRQDKWMSGDIRIIVATNAFGMGIDKPNVRFVCHFDMPESIESYFQEAGRAGRDGLKSYATLLWNNSDLTRMKQIGRVTFPEIKYIKEVYQKVFTYLSVPYEEGAGQTYKFNFIEFSRQFKLHYSTVYYAIKYLESSGYWTLTEEIDNPTRIMFVVNRDELYRIQLTNSALDVFIKAIMRIYPALFSHLVSVDEEFIARVINNSVESVKSRLLELSRLKVIRYIPRVRSPLICFNNERLTKENLFISKSNYDNRKSIYHERMGSIIEYCSSEVDKSDTYLPCRSRRLLAYFGEVNANQCGICDLCNEDAFLL